MKPFLGGRDSDIDGRATDRSLIVIAAEVRGAGIGRIRMAPVPDASAESLIPFIRNAVSEGAVVHTDGWSGYLPLSRDRRASRARGLLFYRLIQQAVGAEAIPYARLLGGKTTTGSG